MWVDGGVGMVHRRLAIIDLSELGAQPMRDGDTTIVFNGCIYNHHELRGELIALGHEFVSLSDTEVLLKGWRQWGEDLPEPPYGHVRVRAPRRAGARSSSATGSA